MSDFLVNTTNTGRQFQPSVESFAGQQYQAVWSDGSDASVKAQKLSTAGAKMGSEFRIDTPVVPNGNTNRQWPALEAAGFGSFAAWIEQPFNNPPPQPRIVLQRFSGGNPAGAPVQVNSADIDTAHRPSVTRMVDGGCVVVWAGARADQRIRAQRFNAEGAKKGPEIAVNTTEGFHVKPAVTVLADGDFVVAWTVDPSAIGGGRLTFRVFAFDGSPQGGEVLPNVGGFQGVNAITLLDNGRFVVAHIESIQPSPLDVSQTTIEASVLSPDGGGSVITSVIAGSPRDFNRTAPALTPLPGGRFLLGWVEKSAVTFATVPHVMAMLCSDSELSLGPPVQVSSGTAKNRFHTCAAAAFGSGPEGVLLAWSDQDANGGVTVRGRTFDVVSNQLA
ncbi:hypothetical protein [Streptomyces sp. NPDC054787]